MTDYKPTPEDLKEAEEAFDQMEKERFDKAVHKEAMKIIRQLMTKLNKPERK